MDMNKAFFLRKEDRAPKWHLIDASGKILGRLSTEIADILRGKNKPEYTSHADAGDYVVVINAEKIFLSGDKLEQKTYISNSGYIGGKKELTAKQVMAKDPARIIMHSVKGMLPKNNLNAQILTKLKVYTGAEHPHKAQIG
ncbi:MAG: 50S ribosomal protein L13 [candidate division TM6 bacterium GW2011_GWF2_32_72]|nr:MAG: 50S ribosomal protein L13 [candidate division TM6 bacterium GW2011_GWF2_32_72]